MPALFLSVLWKGKPEDFPEEGISFGMNQNPLIVPNGDGTISVLAFSLVPTEEEKQMLARAIEAQQKVKYNNNVHVEVKDVQDKPIVKPEEGAVGVQKSIQLVVLPADEAEKKDE